MADQDPERGDNPQIGLEPDQTVGQAADQEQAVSMLCRDCFTRSPYPLDPATLLAPSTKGRARLKCPSCHKPRLLAHPELDALAIAHVDCDAFYASVEKRDNPDLAHKPVIIGGGQRGVVSTACYLARMRGVGSAMPMYKALKLCPDAVVIKPDMTKYRAVSRAIRARFDQLTPAVEPLSIDEAFLDLSGTERLSGRSPAEQLIRLVADIEQAIGITVSVGLSHNKFLAKLASDLEKPRGFSIIGRAETLSRLAPLPITKIFGIGAKSAERLMSDGISEISQVQSMEEADLIRRYGEIGQRLYRLSRGDDSRMVKSTRQAKSVSSETTFRRDLGRLEDLETPLLKAAEAVSRDLKAKALAGRTVTLKLKTSLHRIKSRSRSLDTPTQMAHIIFEVARDLLARELEPNGRTPEAYRLIGVGISQFDDPSNADLPDLLEPDIERRHAREKAVDSLKSKFGSDAITSGRFLDHDDKPVKSRDSS